jgi:hypothetical protein
MKIAPPPGFHPIIWCDTPARRAEPARNTSISAASTPANPVNAAVLQRHSRARAAIEPRGIHVKRKVNASFRPGDHMKKLLVSIAAALGAAFAASPAAAGLSDFSVSVEAPGATATTASFSSVGVETFDSRALGIGGFTSNFGGSGITGTYSGVNILPVSQYGGAGNTGQFASAGVAAWGNAEYSVSFASSLTYFGFWLSALDSGNSVEFFNGATSLGSFTPTDVLAFVSGNSAYYGNPVTGANRAQPYAFVNFFANSGTSFDKIVFRQTDTVGGYESDNHTVGIYTAQGGGTPIGAVPEPATWAMMILGFGLIGTAMRRRRTGAALLPA